MSSDLDAEREQLKSNLQELVVQAYGRRMISRTQDSEGVTFTIKVPHVPRDHEDFDLFKFAAEHAC